MWTFETERTFEASTAQVEAAIAAVIEQLWGDRARLVAATRRADRIDAIDTGTSDPAAWLTWQLESDGSQTRLRIVIDELDEGPNPTAELRAVLGLIERHVEPPSSPRGGPSTTPIREA